MIKKLFFTLTITALFFTNCATRQASVAEALTVVEALETTATHDEGVVINGVRWATRNVDAPGTFAPYPESSGMFFQWNRRKGWNETSDFTAWNSSMPIGTTWERENDPCPQGWRVPAQEQLISLYNAGHTWTADWNDAGIRGRVFGTYPYQIFLPATGFRGGGDGSLHSVGSGGLYWSSTQSGSENAWRLVFGSGRVSIFSNSRANGFSIRCVAIK